jgi:hypothetical protein
VPLGTGFSPECVSQALLLLHAHDAVATGNDDEASVSLTLRVLDDGFFLRHLLLRAMKLQCAAATGGISSFTSKDTEAAKTIMTVPGSIDLADEVMELVHSQDWASTHREGARLMPFSLLNTYLPGARLLFGEFDRLQRDRKEHSTGERAGLKPSPSPEVALSALCGFIKLADAVASCLDDNESHALFSTLAKKLFPVYNGADDDTDLVRGMCLIKLVSFLHCINGQLSVLFPNFPCPPGALSLLNLFIKSLGQPVGAGAGVISQSCAGSSASGSAIDVAGTGTDSGNEAVSIPLFTAVKTVLRWLAPEERARLLIPMLNVLKNHIFPKTQLLRQFVIVLCAVWVGCVLCVCAGISSPLLSVFWRTL